MRFSPFCALSLPKGPPAAAGATGGGAAPGADRRARGLHREAEPLAAPTTLPRRSARCEASRHQKLSYYPFLPVADASLLCNQSLSARVVADSKPVGQSI